MIKGEKQRTRTARERSPVGVKRKNPVCDSEDVRHLSSFRGSPHDVRIRKGLVLHKKTMDSSV